MPSQFPSHPQRETYSLSSERAFVDALGKKWQWNGSKFRWEPFQVYPSNIPYDANSWDSNDRAPTKNAVRDRLVAVDSAIAAISNCITQAYTASATPPLNTSLPWFDLYDQSWNVFQDGVWIMTGGNSSGGGSSQPLDPDLAAYAADPTAAILANMPDALSITTSEPGLPVIFGNAPLAIKISLLEYGSYYTQPFTLAMLGEDNDGPAIVIAENGNLGLDSASFIIKLRNGFVSTVGEVITAINNYTSLYDVELFAELAPGSSAQEIASEVDYQTLFPITPAAAYIGQLCKTPTAWWRWDGEVWIEDVIGRDLTAGPVLSIEGESSIADGALTISQTNGLQNALNSKLNVNAAITTVTASTYTPVTADKLSYLRFTADVAKTLVLPVTGGPLVLNAGDVITVRNAGDANLTISPANISVSINFDGTANVVTPSTTAQLIYLGNEQWDIL
jgi:hypothetical protein